MRPMGEPILILAASVSDDDNQTRGRDVEMIKMRSVDWKRKQLFLNEDDEK